jgi:phosphohistidine phosphatase SixA
MKKLIFVITLLLSIGTIKAQKVEFVPYKKALPTIDADGTVKTTDGKTFKIEGFKDTATTIFFLVRHAEKDTAGGVQADLTGIGRGRADILTKIFKKVKISRVYSTATPRTRNTAAPLAKFKRRDVEIYDVKTQDELVKDLISRGGGRRYFIVGHSNTVPKLSAYLIGEDNEFSKLYIISVKKVGKAKVQVINY